VRRRDVHLPGEAQRHHRLVHGLHRREQALHGGRVLAGEHLVPDGDAGDARAGKERLHVLRHPGPGLARVRQVEEVLVADDELHARAGERREHGRVGVVELHAVHVQRLQQARHLRRVREVVRDLPVVDAELEWRRRCRRRRNIDGCNCNQGRVIKYSDLS